MRFKTLLFLLLSLSVTSISNAQPQVVNNPFVNQVTTPKGSPRLDAKAFLQFTASAPATLVEFHHQYPHAQGFLDFGVPGVYARYDSRLAIVPPLPTGSTLLAPAYKTVAYYKGQVFAYESCLKSQPLPESYVLSTLTPTFDNGDYTRVSTVDSKGIVWAANADPKVKTRLWFEYNKVGQVTVTHLAVVNVPMAKQAIKAIKDFIKQQKEKQNVVPKRRTA